MILILPIYISKQSILGYSFYYYYFKFINVLRDGRPLQDYEILNKGQYRKDPASYKHRELPFGKDLHGDELEKALTTDVVVKKLAPIRQFTKKWKLE